MFTGQSSNFVAIFGCNKSGTFSQRKRNFRRKVFSILRNNAWNRGFVQGKSKKVPVLLQYRPSINEISTEKRKKLVESFFLYIQRLYIYRYYKGGVTDWFWLGFKQKTQQKRNIFATEAELSRKEKWTLNDRNATKAELFRNGKWTIFRRLQQKRNILGAKCNESGTFMDFATESEHSFPMRPVRNHGKFRFGCETRG